MKSLNTYIAEALEGSRMKYIGKHTHFADIIIENGNGEILILRRANYMKNFRTCWCIPGGTVDAKDKNTVETVVRETMEETGIEIDMAQQLKLKPIFTYKFENGNVSDIYYIKLENTPDVKLSKEHSKYEWVRFSDEKIDGRKWVPETFTILQKWEQKPLNERLIVNKNYNPVETIYDSKYLYVIDFSNERTGLTNFCKFKFNIYKNNEISNDYLNYTEMWVDMDYDEMFQVKNAKPFRRTATLQINENTLNSKNNMFLSYYKIRNIENIRICMSGDYKYRFYDAFSKDFNKDTKAYSVDDICKYFKVDNNIYQELKRHIIDKKYTYQITDKIYNETLDFLKK